jgi:hypothetical protein
MLTFTRGTLSAVGIDSDFARRRPPSLLLSVIDEPHLVVGNGRQMRSFAAGPALPDGIGYAQCSEARSRSSSPVVSQALLSQRQPSSIKHQRSVFHFPCFSIAFRGYSSAFRLPPSAFCLLPSALCPLPSALCLLSSVFCLLSSVFCLLSSAFRLFPSALCFPRSQFQPTICHEPTTITRTWLFAPIQRLSWAAPTGPQKNKPQATP